MFEILETATLALIPIFMLLDLVWQSRRYEKPRFWRTRGLLVTIVIVYLSVVFATFWSKVYGDFRLLDSRGLGVWGGAALGILVYEFMHYWYHRLAHQWNWLWLAGHQMHHSAESLDAYGALYQHPVDAFMFTTISSIVFFPLMGLGGEAAVVATLFLMFNAFFQHANINTPRWLGYIIQRPESHAIHHGKGIHRHNYSDLPLWDIVFGTFRNPTREEIPQECGFYLNGSGKVVSMLLFQDINKQQEESAESQDHEPVATGTTVTGNPVN